MKHTALTLGVLALSATTAYAGLDRSGQGTGAIFGDDGAALSFGFVKPSVTGTDAAGNDYDVGKEYMQWNLSYKRSINDQLSFSVIVDQPFGADVEYNNNPTTSALGGTMADLDSQGVTLITKYKLDDRISLFGGIGVQQVEAKVNLNGTAYVNALATAAVAQALSLPNEVVGGVLTGDAGAIAAAGAAAAAIPGAFGAARAGLQANDGYKFELKKSNTPTFLIGAAYEIPDIAFRLAATYRFQALHKADTVEHINGGTVKSDLEFDSPQSLNIDFQTGIAQDTLLTASYRWAEYGILDIIPTRLGSDLVNIDDTHSYSVGIARRFSDELVGTAKVTYEPATGNKTVSPLGPRDGLTSLTLGGRYSTETMNISAGMNYAWLGDAKAGVGGREAAEFKDNTSISFGLKAEFKF